jgi:hypothetical protein
VHPREQEAEMELDNPQLRAELHGPGEDGVGEELHSDRAGEGE